MIDRWLTYDYMSRHLTFSPVHNLVYGQRTAVELRRQHDRAVPLEYCPTNGVTRAAHGVLAKVLVGSGLLANGSEVEELTCIFLSRFIKRTCI